jgi:hypothetical protein
VVESFKAVEQSYENTISHGKVSETNQAQNAFKTENRSAFPDGPFFQFLNVIGGMKTVSGFMGRGKINLDSYKFF